LGSYRSRAAPNDGIATALENLRRVEANVAVNTGKVIVGGLAAGLVANVCDFVTFSFILKDRMAAEMNALNPALAAKSMAPAGMTGAVVLDFVIGLTLVWVYASIRATYGPGPKTAMRAALMLWILFSAIYGSMTAMGMYSWGFYYIALPITLVTTMLTALVGGMIYKE
jgi:hypothetical protein